MLKKLLKYEFRFIGKFLAIWYVITFCLALLTRLFFAIGTTTFTQVLAQIFSGALIAVMINTVINALMRYWVRFRLNFYKDESYLTHTLPLEKGTLYGAKAIGALLVMFVSILFVALCALIGYGTPENFVVLKNLFFAIGETTQIPFGWTLVLALFVLIAEFVNLLFAGFVGMVIGHRKENNKMGYSVLFGAIIYVAAQLIMLLTIFVVGLFNHNIMQILTSKQAVDVSTLITILGLGCIVYTLTATAIYLLGNCLFKKGVNVD